jgi:hypothetical protein
MLNQDFSKPFLAIEIDNVTGGFKPLKYKNGDQYFFRNFNSQLRVQIEP